MSYINDEGRIVGFEPDLIAELSRRMGFDYDLVNVEWPGLFGGLITKKFDLVVSSVTILDERKERMAFSTPYLKSGLALVVRKDYDDIQSTDDLAEKHILTGAQLGTTAYFFLEKRPDIPKKGYQVYGHAITDLINGEIDAVVGESTGTLYYKNQQKEYFQKIRMVGEILTEEFYGIVLRKDDRELLSRIDQTLIELINDGTLARLHAKWELGRAAQVPVAPSG
jgi:polar amino acid transport system substrate-binding protein